MVKHLYFNPKNFHELILSGVLIEMLKNDVEVHSHEEGESLRFVQGQNVIQNSIEAILLFASDIAKYKIFGSNSQQTATIDMINGVCKDIEKKLLTAETSQELIQKIEHLNVFWLKKSNSWLRKRFFFCHMNLLILSFKLQQKFPQILTKYAVFVELRKLFIEQKLMSKQSLIAMFAHPENKYQQFDLFPELESQSHQIPSVTDEMIQKVTTEQTKVQNSLENNDEKTYQEQQRITQISNESENSHIKKHGEESNKIDTEQRQQNHIQKHDENHGTESSRYDEHSGQIQTQVKIQKLTDHENHISTAQRDVSIVEPENVVISHIRHPGQSAIVSTMFSQIYQTLEQTVPASEMQQKTQSHQLQNSDGNQSFSKMKKSLKQSFSQHFTKPLEYSTKNVIEEEKPENIHQGEGIPDAIHQENKNKKQQKPLVSDQQKSSNKNPLIQKKQETAAVKLNNQLVIDEAESEQYVSHEHAEPAQQKMVQQGKLGSPVLQDQLQNKAPQSESNASWQKGPTSTMNKNKIKPKEQTVVLQKETCKCEIF